VTVSGGGDITGWVPLTSDDSPGVTETAAVISGGEPLPAPLAGNIFNVLVSPGQTVKTGDPLIVLEAMKMETNVSAPRDGTVGQISVKPGDAVTVGDTLLTLV
ncbi:UNVERIFIED_CONTAM: hypothetical protein GTU68_008186, partial [Idotea baltica]|nr:hypothetical protein [Idotea baltica]